MSDANLPTAEDVKGILPPTPEDLTTAPGRADFTFGSVLSEMIRRSFQRHTLQPLPGEQTTESKHRRRSFTRCLHCEGTDSTRPHGERPSLASVVHTPECLLAKHLPRLRAMANKDVT